MELGALESIEVLEQYSCTTNIHVPVGLRVLKALPAWGLAVPTCKQVVGTPYPAFGSLHASVFALDCCFQQHEEAVVSHAACPFTFVLAVVAAYDVERRQRRRYLRFSPI